MFDASNLWWLPAIALVVLRVMTIKVGFFPAHSPRVWAPLGRAPRPPPGSLRSWSHGKPTLTRQLRKWSFKLYLAVDCRHWFQNSEWFNQISDNEPQAATIRLSHERERRRWRRQRTDLRRSAQARELKNRNGKSGGVETWQWTCPGWKHSTSALPLKPMRSLSWKCLQHIQLIPLRVAAKGRLKAARRSKENVIFLSDVLICFKGKQNRREVGIFFFLIFLLFCAVHIETRYLELALSQHPLLDAGQTGPIIAQISADFVQVFSSQQQIPALTLNSDSQPPACFSSSAKPAWGCHLCPTKAGDSPTPHGMFCGEILFFPLFIWLWREVRPYSDDGVEQKVTF